MNPVNLKAYQKLVAQPTTTPEATKNPKLPAIHKSGAAKASKAAAGDKAAKWQKETKEPKAPRAQGAYTFFAADRRAAVKGAQPMSIHTVALHGQ